MKKEIELILPAGNFEKLKYVLAYGADAVYLGVPQFSLRARENGFKKRLSVVESVDYAHALGKKVYITANIFPHNHKIDSFLKYIKTILSECKPEAWIMSDPGLIMLLKENFPEQNIHLSVQANTMNYASVRFWQKIGIQRIILSRELSISEIKKIKDACPNMELEVFVHGSICIAYSGRCLISNYLSYRDSNQGTCSNSCRWKYHMYHQNDNLNRLNTEGSNDLKGNFFLVENERPGNFMPIDEDEHGSYLMNSKDLCAIEHLKELYDAGVSSFKIEGRSKSVYYAASIARVYRWAIDTMLENKPFNKNLMNEIYATSNRGITLGFLKGHPGYTAQNYDDSRSQHTDSRFSGISRDFDEKNKLVKIEPRNPLKKGMKLEMILPDQTVPFIVEKILTSNFQEIDEIHGGQDCCWVPLNSNPGTFALFREKLEFS